MPSTSCATVLSRFCSSAKTGADGVRLTKVGLCCIATHHTVAVEVRRILGDRSFHDFGPARLRAIAVKQGQHHLLELRVELVSIIDAPTGHTLDATLEPPPIGNRQAGYSIERCLHSARPGCLQRR